MAGMTPINTPPINTPPINTPALAQTPRSDGDPRAVGKAFEGMFASMLMKQMRQTLDGGMFAGDNSDVLGGLFDHFIGEHIAKSGGLGIGDMIRMQLERQPGRTQRA